MFEGFLKAVRKTKAREIRRVNQIKGYTDQVQKSDFILDSRGPVKAAGKVGGPR